MKQKTIILAIIDGLMGCLLWNGVANFYISKYYIFLSIKTILLISSVAALISSVLYAILLPRKNEAKIVGSFTVLSILGFLAGIVATLILRISIPMNILPSRETNTADGFGILFSFVSFVFVSIITRCIILVVTIVNKRIKSNN